MKKKTYVWLAFLLLMLVATLTSCEKFALDDSGTNSHDANANVIIHASVAKNNSTRTRSGEGNEEIEGKPLEDYCSRLSIAIFDGEEKVKTLNLKAEDGYKDIGINLDAGKYRMVAIGHNGSGNCTISSAMQPLTAVCRRAVLINTVEPVPVRMAVIRNFILTVQIWVTCSVISSGICSMEDPTVVEEVTVSTVMEMVDFISITATDRVPADSDRMAILETLAAAAVLAEVSSGRKEATFMQMSP